jgi:hypothetical protein
VKRLKRVKIGEEPLVLLNISTAPATFHKCKQKHSDSKTRDGNCHVFANSGWAILPPLLLADSGYLRIAQRLSNSL